MYQYSYSGAAKAAEEDPDDDPTIAGSAAAAAAGNTPANALTMWGNQQTMNIS